MSLITGFRRRRIGDGVELWSVEEASLDLGAALDMPVVSLGKHPEVVLRPSGETPSYQQEVVLRAGRHRLRGHGPVLGILIGRTASETAAAAFAHLDPALDTELGQWIARGGLGDDAPVALGAGLERGLGDRGCARRVRLGRSVPNSGFGVLTESYEPDLAPIEIEDESWLFPSVDRGEHAVVAEHRPCVGGQCIPQKIWAIKDEERDGIRYWDGRECGLVQDLEQIPEHLRRRLERSGRCQQDPELRHALTDLEVLFLVRSPTGRECLRLEPQDPPTRCDKPAILIPAIEPVRLLGGDERPIDVPVIAEPAQALSILGRCFSGRIYIPHTPCVPRRHISLPDHPTWIAGVLPRCLWTP